LSTMWHALHIVGLGSCGGGVKRRDAGVNQPVRRTRYQSLRLLEPLRPPRPAVYHFEPVQTLKQDEEVFASSVGPVIGVTDTVGGGTNTVRGTVGGATDTVRGATDNLLGGEEKQR
jgi:hypothetical protein